MNLFGTNPEPNHSGTIRMAKDANGVQHTWDANWDRDPRLPVPQPGQDSAPAAQTGVRYQGSEGPAVLDLTQLTGRINIVVDPKATRSEVVVHTDSDSGPSAEAVRRTTFDQQGICIKVHVPIKDDGGNTMVINGGSIVMGNVSFGGRMIVNGVDVTEAVRRGQAEAGRSEIVTDAVLPPGSWVKIDTKSARADVKGKLESLDVSATTGSITAEETKEFIAYFSSGDVRVSRVTGKTDVRFSSGNLDISAYSGSEAHVSLSSGNAHIGAAPESSGRLTVQISSGNATVTGARHLDTRRSRVSSGHLSIH